MPSAGGLHTLLLRSDGQVVACGDNEFGQCNLPEVQDGVAYRQVAAGGLHTVLLRTDGRVVASGLNHHGQCDLPEAEDGVSYAQVAAGWAHTVLLRTDGRVVARGGNDYGQCDLPEAGDGVCYTQVAGGMSHTLLLRSDRQAVAYGGTCRGQMHLPEAENGECCTQIAAGNAHTVLLRSDGRVVACGWNVCGQCDLPEPEDGECYTQVAAGALHTVLLRSDGLVVACGWNVCGQCDLPEPEDGECYTQVAAGALHTVLLRHDGKVVTCGFNGNGECDVPEVAGGLRYTRVAAGGSNLRINDGDDGDVEWAGHTVLLLSNGEVVACGDNHWGQCDTPKAEAGVVYVPGSAAAAEFVVQLLVDELAEGLTATCRDLSGAAIATWTVGGEELEAVVLSQVRRKITRPGVRLQVVLPDGRVLMQTPGLTWAQLLGLTPSGVRATLPAGHLQCVCRGGRRAQWSGARQQTQRVSVVGSSPFPSVAGHSLAHFPTLTAISVQCCSTPPRTYQCFADRPRAAGETLKVG